MSIVHSIVTFSCTIIGQDVFLTTITLANIRTFCCIKCAIHDQHLILASCCFLRPTQQLSSYE